MLGELQPWFSGWPSLDRFRRDMDELFDRFFGEIGYRGSNSSMTMWPAVESFFRDGNWVMRVDLPGVDPKDIDVSVAGDTLTIRASRERRSEERNQHFETREISYGRFERSMTLPKGVRADQIKANYRNGVLELTMPASPELAGRRIPVGVDKEEKGQIEHQAT
jgi:HSP20 family protein